MCEVPNFTTEKRCDAQSLGCPEDFFARRTLRSLERPALERPEPESGERSEKVSGPAVEAPRVDPVVAHTRRCL